VRGERRPRARRKEKESSGEIFSSGAVQHWPAAFARLCLREERVLHRRRRRRRRLVHFSREADKEKVVSLPFSLRERNGMEEEEEALLGRAQT